MEASMSWDKCSGGPEVEDRFVRNQQELNQLFRSLNISFDDPNRIADVLTQMTNDYWGTAQHVDSNLGEREWTNAQEQTLILRSLIKEVSGLPLHRHRMDAAMIIKEVSHRLVDPLNPLRVESNPMFTPYPGPVAEDAEHRKLVEEDELVNLRATREIGDELTLPPDARDPPLSSIPQDHALPLENISLSYWVQQPRDGLHWMRLLQQKARENPGPPVPEYLDNPADLLLHLPDHFPLIDGPVPEVTLWREEDIRRPEVYDSRKEVGGYTSRENDDSYLFKFACLVQDVLLQPEVAMKYTIILRATRGRYLDTGPDEIWNESAPTSTEVEQLMHFFATGFPLIVLTRFNEPLLSGTHDRWTAPDRIQLSGEQFDLIEQAQRENKPVGHGFYRMYCTIFHEMGHYLNTHINAPFHQDFLTPRKLRLYLQPRRDMENPAHPRFYRLFPHTGEMGELIEMLIFGHKVNITTRDPDAGMTVNVRGSTPGPYDDTRAQITIPHEILEYMFCARVPLRLDGQALRELIRGLELTKLEERGALLPSERLLRNSRIDPDAFSARQDIPGGFGGYRYRRAIRRLQQDLLEMAYGIEFTSPAQISEEYWERNKVVEENPYDVENKWGLLWNWFIFLCSLPVIYLVGLPVGSACGLVVYCGISSLEGAKLLRGWWRWYIRHDPHAPTVIKVG
ncbi:hypothetical protein L873DRAFT_1842722 [Choiromyces venosus 120613-1]|uniref:Uncharacterized protein n=1 Tax=Choiromyces venosus 120613-1 TaxID=1336337 RepID=A0A3N4JV48_9PEZI|nr:hypothetical protein L873DRAFT_1842722 [Choiromyces venosus 120613-1]